MIRCARFAQSVCRTCAVARAWVGIDTEIVLRFQRAGLDKEPVSGPRFQRFRTNVLNGRLHAADAVAIRKHFYRNGIGVRFQFPDRKGIFVAFQSGYGNNLERSELEWGSESEINVAETPVVSDGHDFGFEPIAEMNNINSAKNDRDSDENPGFFIHKQLNGMAASAVEPPIQTLQGVEML